MENSRTSGRNGVHTKFGIKSGGSAASSFRSSQVRGLQQGPASIKPKKWKTYSQSESLKKDH